MTRDLRTRFCRGEALEIVWCYANFFSFILLAQAHLPFTLSSVCRFHMPTLLVSLMDIGLVRGGVTMLS